MDDTPEAAGPPGAAAVVGLVGVYDADHTLLGELSYVVGKIAGVRHCGLCDVTHSPVRRKREWDAYVATLDVPFTLLHRDERDDAVRAATSDLPVVLARLEDGRHEVLLGPAYLDAAGGSVERFAAALGAARAGRGGSRPG